MLIDSHCHIPHKKYEKTPEEIVKEAQEEGIEKLITIGTSLKENKLVLKTASDFDNVFCAIGIYPHEDKDKSIKDLYRGLEETYKKNIEKVVGIGECGIDLLAQAGITAWEGGRSVGDQLELFKMQVGFGVEHDLPIIFHNRNGDDLILDTLKKYKVYRNRLRGIAHCFTQNWALAEELIDLGFYISFAGNITYPSASQDLLEVVKKIPHDKFVIETDSPYLPPQGHRGETNYPKYVKIVAEKIADIRKTSFETISKQSFKNTCDLFFNKKI